MRYLSGFMCVCALGVIPLAACVEATGDGGRGGSAGSGGTAGDGGGGGTGGACEGNVCPCSEAGILAAIEAGGDVPYTFDCDGPTTVVTQVGFFIDNDVILDGEGNLTVALDPRYKEDLERVFSFSVPEGVKAELHRLTADSSGAAIGQLGGVINEGTLTIQGCVISGSSSEFGPPWEGGGIYNAGEMTIINSTVSKNRSGHLQGGGIYNGCSATLMLVNSTVSGNVAGIDGTGAVGGGIFNEGEMTIINSTVSGNAAGSVIGDVSGGGIANAGWMSLTNSTVSGNSADSGDAIASTSASRCPDLHTEIANTLIDGDCDNGDAGATLIWASKGYNIESPGNTCGFDQQGDQAGVGEQELNLGPLADNRGPTMTHALLPGSVAIDRVPAVDCGLAEDQRGEPRPETDGTLCDVGAFEGQPPPPRERLPF